MTIKHLFCLLLASFFCTCACAQPLDTLRAMLRQNNPEIRALELDYRAALQQSSQVSQLPDLELGAGFFILPVETRTGPQRFRVGASQMLPWPGKLAAMAAVADARARPLLEKVAARQLMLMYRLETAYYRLADKAARAEVLRENLDLFDGLEALALSRLESGRGSSVDVYRLQMERRQLERQLEEFSQAGQREMATINGLLSRPPDVQISPSLDPVNRVAQILEYAPDLANDDPDLSDHPSLRIFAWQREASRSAIALSALEQRPDFGIGLDYIAVGRRSDLDPPGNGRDILLPRAMVRIPLSKEKYSARRQEEEIRMEALEARRQSTEDELRAEIRRALVSIDEAAGELLFLEEQNRTLAASLTIARSEFANGKRPLDELLRLEYQSIQYQHQAVMARTTILLQDAAINRLLYNQ
ncbi:TolC family protein [Lewinella sp. W8]|uniref:TolC family protein n=1 Tax=Lewinella sp. W8 TaxID=2528208 RepID=UPI0010687BB4|nr:TolC family protein [Lewinella sp. W8]MTB50023.1 hypothetical protein [Lewinella sp. W8]